MYFVLKWQVALPAIVAINVTLVLMVKTYWRFLLPIAVWMGLFASFFVLAHANSRQADRIQQAYDESARGRSYGDTTLWQKLKDGQAHARLTQLEMFWLLGFQTLLVLVTQIAGFVKTGRRNLFWWTRTLFVVLAIGWIILAAFSAIVPTGPLV